MDVWIENFIGKVHRNILIKKILSVFLFIFANFFFDSDSSLKSTPSQVAVQWEDGLYSIFTSTHPYA